MGLLLLLLAAFAVGAILKRGAAHVGRRERAETREDRRRRQEAQAW